MRSRKKVLDSLEASYREAYDLAGERDDDEAMARLDLDFQRDQLHLEILLDVRDLLTSDTPDDEPEKRSLLDEGSALIEKAGKLRRITRFR